MLTDKFTTETKKAIKIIRFVKSLPGLFLTFRYLKVYTDNIDKKITEKFNPFIFVLYYKVFIVYHPRDICSVTSSSEGSLFHLAEER